MNRWYRAVLAVVLAVMIGSCSTAVVDPQEQGQVTDPAPAVASLNLPVATVVSVGDGDTLRMDYQGESITVRFACIDAPETAQTPWDPAATDRLRQLTPRDSTIQFREADTDRFGRRSMPMARTLTSRWSRRVTQWSIPNSSVAAQRQAAPSRPPRPRPSSRG